MRSELSIRLIASKRARAWPAALADIARAYFSRMRYPVTPIGRYFVVLGRLWRMSDVGLSSQFRKELVSNLMDARRAVAVARRNGRR